MVIRKNFTEAFDFDGLKIIDYTGDLKEKSSFAVIEAPPGKKHGLSYSTVSDKFYYIIEGSVTFIIEDKQYDFASGDFFIIHQGERFDYWANNVTAKISLFHTPGFDINNEVFIDT